MAVASAVGSQVMNILIGLGVPWSISTSAGLPITIPDGDELTMMIGLMCVCIVVYLAAVLVPSVGTWGRWGRATLDRTQGWLLFATYALVAAIYLCWFLMWPHPSQAPKHVKHGGLMP